MTALWFRTDLIEVDDTRDPRRAKLIDAVSGRVARLSRHDLSLLRTYRPRLKQARADQLSADQSEADLVPPSLVADALRMGLMNRRVVPRPSRWARIWASGPARWLCIRVPLFSVDRLAQQLSRQSGLLFHPLAVAVWSLAIMVCAASVLFGWQRAIESAGRMHLWGEQSAGGWLAIAIVFVLTKVAHELGHATACRRSGAACGEIGMMIFAGVPCPYCDVSLVSRLDSAASRAGVMLAGIYVELVLASIATVCWWLSGPGMVQAIALNVMMVCGISTVLFNANPLMRLDGYYVLADVIATANLRGRAAAAWQGLITSRLAGWPRGRVAFSCGEAALAAYHGAAVVYRLMVMVAIAWMVFAVSGSIQMRPLGIALVMLLAVPLLGSVMGTTMAVLAGKGPWHASPAPRRWAIVAAVITITGLILFTPIRREVIVSGRVDVARWTPIHASRNGWIVQMQHDYHAPVRQGDPLWQLDDPQLQFELVAWNSRQRLATLQSAALRRSALHDDSTDMAWDLDAANRRLVNSQLQSLVDRQTKQTVLAPMSGILLPPEIPATRSGNGQTTGTPAVAAEHADGTAAGRYVTAGEYLGRVGDPTSWCVTLVVEARHRRLIRPGQVVRTIGDLGDDTTAPWSVDTVVGSISEIQPNDHPTASNRQVSSSLGSLWDDSSRQFEVRCDLPSGSLSAPLDASTEQATRVTPASWATVPMGSHVIAKIRVADESLWQKSKRWMREAIGG